MEETSPGVYEMLHVEYGGVFVKESKAPAAFQLDENAYYVEVAENGKTYEVETEAGKGFINAAQTGNLYIKKTSDDNVLQGFTFKVEGTDATGRQFYKEYVTDEKGEIHIELRVGEYTISELSNEATEKYILPDAATVTVEADSKSKGLVVTNAFVARRLGLYPCGAIPYQPGKNRRNPGSSQRA